MTPCRGNTIFLPFLPAPPSFISRTLEGLFELTRRPSRAFISPRALLPDPQRYKDTIRYAALGAEVQGHCQQQLTQTLIVCLLKTHFFTPILDFEKSTQNTRVSGQTWPRKTPGCVTGPSKGPSRHMSSRFCGVSWCHSWR